MIKKFEQYNEIDPYGEEKWENINDFNDIMNYLKNLESNDIKCRKPKHYYEGDYEFYDNYDTNKFWIQSLKVVDSSSDPIGYAYFVYSDDIQMPVSQDEAYKIWKYMKGLYELKAKNESIDLDPYGEENWNGEETRVDPDTREWDDDYYDRMEQVPGECRICGRYAPNALMLDDVCPDCRAEDKEFKCRTCGDTVLPGEELIDGQCIFCLQNPDLF